MRQIYHGDPVGQFVIVSSAEHVVCGAIVYASSSSHFQKDPALEKSDIVMSLA